MLLIGKRVIQGPGATPKLPDAEYLDVGILPTLVVSRVYYKPAHTRENLGLGVSPTWATTRVYHKNMFGQENLSIGINPTMIVTKTGVNPL